MLAAAALALAFWLRWNWGQVAWVSWTVQYAYLFGTYLFFLGLSSPPTLLGAVGENTMGIYLLHTPVLLKAVSLAVNPLVSSPIASFFLIAAATLAASHAGARVLLRLPVGSRLLGVVREEVRRPGSK